MREHAQRRGVRRVGFTAIVAVVISVGGGVLATSASAADLFVGCGGFTSIQDAVDAANNGDNIHICAGTYHGAVDATGKLLAFLGPQVSVDPRAEYPRSGGEAIIDGDSGTALKLSSGSAVNGLTIADSTSPGSSGIVTGDHNTVEATVFTGVVVAVEVKGTDFSGLLNVLDASQNGYDFGSGDGEGSLLSSNIFTDSLQGTAISAVNSGGTSVARIHILDNTSFGEAGFLQAQGTSDMQVEDNTIVGSGQNGQAIGFSGGVTDFTVSNNVITGFNGAAVSVADNESIPTNGPGSIVTNRLQGNRRGIEIVKSAGASPVNTIDAHFNILSGNTFGLADPISPNAAIRNTGGGTVNAEGNFYGCNTGPNTAGCDAVLGAATADPFLVLSSAIGTKTLTSAQTTTFTADLNHDNHGALVGTPVLDGLGITFSASGGLSVFPASAVLTAGTASTTVKPKANGGVGWTGQKVSGRVVNATTSQTGITVKPLPPTLTVHDASTTEGTSGTHLVNFSVTLSHKYDKAVTVKYATANGTAKAGSDYLAKSGTLTFPAGVTSKPIGVTIKGDKVKEANETFAVTIFAPTNASIADPNATGVIRNS